VLEVQMVVVDEMMMVQSNPGEDEMLMD